MKRILTLCVFLMSLTLALPAFAQDNVFENNLEMLDAFDIIEASGNEQADTLVTRGEFAKYLAAALKFPPCETTSFNDVKGSDITSVATLEQHGIVRGSRGSFLPDDIIKTTDAVVMIMRAIGYELPAQESGGYAGGYMSQAAEADILTNIENLSGYADLETAVQLLCNMLEANVYIVDKIVGDKFSYVRGDTFLEEY